MRLGWHPEGLRGTGGIGGDGILRLLGAPNLDLIEVLVRETVQNSWDAGLGKGEPVHYSMQGETLSGDRMQALRELVFAETIEADRREPGLRDKLSLLDILEQRTLDVLFVGDSGTRGLGGPTRAGVPVEDGVHTDFRDFVFMIGAPTEQEYRGGSYGFGKAISFLASAARCVLIFTRTHKGMPGAESRFIASGLSSSFALNGRELTGRHWWGQSGPDDSVAPITGPEAEELASKLGFPLPSGSGTTFMILAPRLGTDSLKPALTKAASSLTRNFWPKMVSLEGCQQPPMTFSVSCNGEPIPVPEPDTTPPLHLHAASLRAVRRARHHSSPPDFQLVTNPISGEEIPVAIRQIQSMRPRAEIGLLGIAIGEVRDGPHREVPAEENGYPFPVPSHWAALMREPELIVRYEAAVEHFAEGLEWGAVFKPHSKWDSVFRDSEPPTHDDWSPRWLSDSTSQRIVRIGIRRVSELIEEFLMSEAPAEHSNPAMRIAEELGDLLPSVPIGPKGRPRSSTGVAQSTGRPKVEIRRSLPVEWDGVEAARFEFTVRANATPSVLVQVRAAIAAHEEGRPDTSVSVLAAGSTDDVTPLAGGASTVEFRVPVDEVWAVIIERPQGLAAVAQITASHEERNDLG